MDSHVYNTTSQSCNTNVLYLLPAEDHNGAFGLTHNLCTRMNGWHKVACTVNLHRVSSIQDAEGIVQRYGTDSLMLTVLAGFWGTVGTLWHGGCGSVRLCQDDSASQSFL